MKHSNWEKTTPWGHRTYAISGRIDWALCSEYGKTVEEIAGECECTVARVKDHMKHLRIGTRNNGKGVIVFEEVGKSGEVSFSIKDYEY